MPVRDGLAVSVMRVNETESLCLFCCLQVYSQHDIMRTRDRRSMRATVRSSVLSESSFEFATAFATAIATATAESIARAIATATAESMHKHNLLQGKQWCLQDTAPLVNCKSSMQLDQDYNLSLLNHDLVSQPHLRLFVKLDPDSGVHRVIDQHRPAFGWVVLQAVF